MSKRAQAFGDILNQMKGLPQSSILKNLVEYCISERQLALSSKPTNKLLPCPFCGGPVKLERVSDTFERLHGIRKWWGIHCRNTINKGGNCAIETIPSASEETAIARWNMRNGISLSIED